MSTAATPPRTTRLEIWISGGRYSLQKTGAASWRLRGPGGIAYAVERLAGCPWDCSCDDHRFRHRHRGGRCKHLSAMAAVGLVDRHGETRP